MMFIDSHAHLNSDDYRTDLDEVLRRAKDAGVETIIVPGTTVETSLEAIALSEKYPNVYACVGIHPHDASKGSSDALEKIERMTEHEKVVAVGEIGLDYHYNFSPRDVQQEAFKKQIQIAIRRNLPIVVHTRESQDDTIAAVADAVKANPGWRMVESSVHIRVPTRRGVFHCFPGGPEEAHRLMELGFFVSYPGIVTFKNSPVIETLKSIGYDHILLETDSPYLAPVPLRGKRNEPANVVLIAQKIAEVFGASVEDVARAARFNTKKLFNIEPFDPPRIAYKLKNSIYLNITIRCNADCVFCDRKGEAIVKGHNLKIEKEPSAEEVLNAIGEPKNFEEIVFCGYGEPTIRLDVVKEVARWVKDKGGRVRLNTDGHGNVINHRNIVPELVGLIDSVSISLNSIDPSQYGELMRLDGEKYHNAMVEFARECVKQLPEVVMTVVGMDDIDIASAKEFVRKNIGADFRVRPYF
ncbi:MAG: YchF/TatD family DNA exonuclease [Ignavibacteriales bacterium]|nr:YchF/TatD family DNA exonuclease [Ignavibacteriales bacterium]